MDSFVKNFTIRKFYKTIKAKTYNGQDLILKKGTTYTLGRKLKTKKDKTYIKLIKPINLGRREYNLAIVSNKDLEKKIIKDYNENEYLDSFPKCKELLYRFYRDYNDINLDNYIKDPFFEIDNLKNLFEWYEIKNPKFLPMNELPMTEVESKFPEFQVFISGMIKDLYFLLENLDYENYKIKNLENKASFIKEILSILQKIEENIRNEYNYSEIIYSIYSYLTFFNYIIDIDKNNNYYEFNEPDTCEILIPYISSPYIIFPSFHQLDFIKINLTIGVPFINFYLVNKIHLVHGIRHNSCFEIYHNIDSHYGEVNLHIFKDLLDFKFKHINNKKKKFISITDVSNSIKDSRIFKILFKTYFECMNGIIKKLEPILIYKIPKSSKKSFETFKNDKDFNYFMNSLVLFYLFHESYFFLYLFTNEYSENLIELFKNNNINNLQNKFSILLIRYFNENFKERIYKRIIHNNKSISQEFMKLLNFTIKDNVNTKEIADLIKEAGERIYFQIFKN
jgi:hypothetical protein